jgi:hypothetical protein
MPSSDPRFPARFDAQAWEEDIARSTAAGVAAAEPARTEYEQLGVPRSQLGLCDAEGQDGTRLPQCFKVYLPQPRGRFGMVFTVDLKDDRLILQFLAFGVRHHPAGAHAATVYEFADKRLHHKRLHR